MTAPWTLKWIEEGEWAGLPELDENSSNPLEYCIVVHPDRSILVDPKLEARAHTSDACPFPRKIAQEVLCRGAWSGYAYVMHDAPYVGNVGTVILEIMTPCHVDGRLVHHSPSGTYVGLKRRGVGDGICGEGSDVPDVW